MSYSRFGCEGSDVYTYPSDRGLECCGCPLIGFFTTRDLDAFAAHLEEHRAAGHTVPDSIMSEIRGDLAWLVDDGIIDAPAPAAEPCACGGPARTSHVHSPRECHRVGLGPHDTLPPPTAQDTP